MERTLRSTQVLKEEAENIGLQGKDIAEYVTRQQTLDREERAEDKKRADELQAEDKKRADEIHMAEKADKIKIQNEQAKIDKELKIKEMELQAQQVQATDSSATTRPPCNKDAKSPKLPSFLYGKDELCSYLLRFERYA